MTARQTVQRKWAKNLNRFGRQAVKRQTGALISNDIAQENGNETNEKEDYDFSFRNKTHKLAHSRVQKKDQKDFEQQIVWNFFDQNSTLKHGMCLYYPCTKYF